MREIVMDTETTGLSSAQGHRIVEIGAIELVNHLPTERVFHCYINPQRDMPAEAEEIHGLSSDFLSDKPVFGDIADEFLTFIGDAPLVIHNAAFDMGFLNAELEACGRPLLSDERAIDSLAIAKRKFPTRTNTLDALCKRFGIDNSRREKHGALLDSELLAEVYLELLGNRQTSLSLVTGSETAQSAAGSVAARVAKPRPTPLPPRLSEDEKAAHKAMIEELGETALWLKSGGR